jgi:hypothetical protein
MANTRSLVLSAIEVKELSNGWPDPMIEDYLSKLEGIVSVTQELQASLDLINNLIAVQSANNAKMNKMKSQIAKINGILGI